MPRCERVVALKELELAADALIAIVGKHGGHVGVQKGAIAAVP